MKVSDVVKAVRTRLGDTKMERWDDDTLILYTSLCQNDICIFTNFYRQKATIELLNGSDVYDLPPETLKVHRLEYQGEFFPIETRNAIDAGRATFPCALKDNLMYNKIEIVLGDSYDDLREALVSTYGVLTDSDTDDISTEDCTLEDDYGVLTNAELDDQVPSTPLGGLTVYYSAVPPILTSLEDELVVPDIWFTAVLHFVSGMALQDDNDANNIQRGDMEGAKYMRLLGELFKQSAKDFTSNVKSKLTMKPRRI